MNLRLILENFRNADLDNLETSIDAKITQFEEEGVRILTGRMPGKESGKFQLKRLLKFKKIQTLLKFIKSLKNGERGEIEQISKYLIEDVADQSAQYFSKGLRKRLSVRSCPARRRTPRIETSG